MTLDDDPIKKAYQEWIGGEMRDARLRREKKEFIRAHFETKPAWLLSPVFTVPAVGLCAMLVFFLYLKPVPVESPQPAGVVTQAGEIKNEVLEPAAEKAVVPERDVPPSVTVKRVESDVGPTMVYQRMSRDVPVVIIWVFAGK